jgi:hypothetical protein
MPWGEHKASLRTDGADVRSRCQMILLSAQGHSAAKIAALTFFDQDTVLFWFDRYEAEGLSGLHDRPRRSKPFSLAWIRTQPKSFLSSAVPSNFCGFIQVQQISAGAQQPNAQ